LHQSHFANAIEILRVFDEEINKRNFVGAELVSWRRLSSAYLWGGLLLAQPNRPAVTTPGHGSLFVRCCGKL
jgi:hypothetical protein